MIFIYYEGSAHTRLYSEEIGTCIDCVGLALTPQKGGVNGYLLSGCSVIIFNSYNTWNGWLEGNVDVKQGGVI